MTPGVFCVENALEILPDLQRRILTEEARRFADEGRGRKEFTAPEGYWAAVVEEHKRILWMDAYDRRKARLVRMNKK